MHYILIDYESIQPADLAAVDDAATNVVVFVGAQQNRLPCDFVCAMQTIGDRGRYRYRLSTQLSDGQSSTRSSVTEARNGNRSSPRFALTYARASSNQARAAAGPPRPGGPAGSACPGLY